MQKRKYSDRQKADTPRSKSGLSADTALSDDIFENIPVIGIKKEHTNISSDNAAAFAFVVHVCRHHDEP